MRSHRVQDSEVGGDSEEASARAPGRSTLSSQLQPASISASVGMPRLQLGSARAGADSSGQDFIDAIGGAPRATADSEDGSGEAEQELTDEDGPGGAAPSTGMQAKGPGGQSASAGAQVSGGSEDQPASLEDQEAASAVAVTFSSIRAGTTPAGVIDRIPPSVDISVTVTLTGWRIPLAPVRISIDGAGGGNGDATIGGAATQDITASGTVTLRGTVQTDPGNAGRLRLVGTLGTRTVGRSNAFTVCAIPQNFNIAFQGLITGSKRGIQVQNQHQSDSGTVADLDQVTISEVVQYGTGTGTFSGITSGNNSGYRSGTAFPTDNHGTPVALITGAGHIEAQQAFKFKDARSGATDIPVKNSGYQITRDVTDDGRGKLEITTSKAGAATNPHGNRSDAGSGNVSRAQAK